MFAKQDNGAESQNGLDISEYIPGNDSNGTLANPPKTEEQRKSDRRRARFLRKLIVGLAALILSIPVFSLGAEIRAEMPSIMQYIFLYFILESVLAENWSTQLLSFGMLFCYGLLMSNLLGPIEFNLLTIAALTMFLFSEKNKWLLAMNILVFGAWTILTIAAFFPQFFAPA